MFRRPITFDEKVDARFTRRGRNDCWWWEGSLHSGHPAINLRGVMRYLYEREVAPIPPGMILVRTDHRPGCRAPDGTCPHQRCVNPAHVIPRLGRAGQYEREVNHELTSSERSAERKRRVRKARRDKERRDDD